MTTTHYAIILAWALDQFFKDPVFFLHPVRIIGRFIAAQENAYRKMFSNEFVGGIFLSVMTVSSVWLVSFSVCLAAGRAHPALGLAANTALIFFSISPSALAAEGTRIFNLLSEGREGEARKVLSMIVGRDTENLGPVEISRACVETIGENSVDGLISPLFFAMLGGGPLAMAYRAVNTCDSMVGYRNERYEKFGKFSARLDDAANFVPARLSILFISVAAFFCRLNAFEALKTGMRDRLKHPSPNSAHGEAAFAGALGVRLGGRSHYGGAAKEKPLLGQNFRPTEPSDIPKAVLLLRITSLLVVVSFSIAALLMEI
ncbi:MAG: cobalamin biosynthesis protein CobD [Nitrospinae bacterium]|nr:cobalamin biosynthesis protein CobD [Nitrospinota bacterium]